MKKILVLTFSNGKNLELGKMFSEVINKKSINCEIVDISSLNLPLYSPQVQEKELKNERIKDIVNKLMAFTHTIWIAPEYNGSVPPTFNNLIAWASVCHEDWRKAFNNKMALIATHSGGGGSHVLMHMRLQLSFVGMNVLGREFVTNYKKPANLESITDGVELLIQSTN